MNTTKKLTKRDHFNALLAIPAVAENQTLVDFINHELEMLDRKNNTDTGKSAELRKSNEAIQNAIVDFMEVDRLYSVTELIKICPACADLSNPKVTNLLYTLKEQGKVERVEEKRKAFFKLCD